MASPGERFEVPLDGRVLSPSPMEPAVFVICAAAATTVHAVRTWEAAAATACPASDPYEADKDGVSEGAGFGD